MCGCGRTIRVSKKVLTEAPILCGGCGGEFTVQDPDTDDHDADDVSGWRGDEPDDEDGSGRRRERAGRRDRAAVRYLAARAGWFVLHAFHHHGLTAAAEAISHSGGAGCDPDGCSAGGRPRRVASEPSRVSRRGLSVAIPCGWCYQDSR